MKISGIGFIYMVTSLTGRIYVGSTNDFDYRFSQYKRLHCKGQIKLYRSLLKHGFVNHTFEVIWAGPIEDMLKYETLIGWGFDVLEKENLNCKLPKFGDTYSVFSNETRYKISKSNLGKIVSIKTRENMSKSGRGRVFTKEHKDNIRKANLGKKVSKEEIYRLQNLCKGKKQTQSHKENAAKFRMKSVIQLSLQDIFIKKWKSMKQAQEELGIFTTNIGNCCMGKAKTAGGFKWKYEQYL